MYEETHAVLVSEPPKTRSLSVCEQLPIGCHPHKDQVLGAWVILAQNSWEFHIFCCSQVLGSCVGIVGVYIFGQNYLCASKDLNKN
jgi:hypothetical protein